ncbi:nicotinate phosphoribosyltransferase [Myxococcus stipitatus DSM 14675]|uniref:Nicotinate phosphoribosyltransferase n=1 Tax=Myxococcus stipitatus (strain DSM 14675 / JCM 12634 / Mx s8) TaxID=1278073 RepID=L7UJ92_MYXSD|nr:nicotinate phosphoribosyltransferase [Myxococcus stipitatus]AGC49051.1 nicotinate phosphoribosyltransferase [Myxococcus stipitatus DSM 14675]
MEPEAALLTDLYQLTMTEAYLAEGQWDEAVFSLFVRRLPSRRNYLVAAGLEDVLHTLEHLRFRAEDLEWLASLGRFSDRLLGWLERFRFSGDVDAMPEGTPVFAQEPLLEVRAPLPEAQLVETYLLNVMHLQTLAASKASRVVEAAQGRPVMEFGLRRIHGAESGVKVARAAYLAGVDSTSNVLAGKRYGIPLAGTMAHSYVQSHDDELEAFRAFTRVYPDATLLVDTYDTLRGVQDAIRLAREQGEDFRVRALRLDSGDLLALSLAARELLDEAGLERVRLVASGGLDEDDVARLLARGAPLDGFGVGTAMGVSADAPSLDMAYKLVEYAGRPRVKLSAGKVLLPGSKQVYRQEEDGLARRDLLVRRGDVTRGRPLLRPVMRAGQRLPGVLPSLDDARAYARRELARLPLEVRALEPARPPYSVVVGDGLARARAHEAEVWATGP